MKTPLWRPSEDRIKKANMTRFIRFVNQKLGMTVKTYPELYQWSVDRIPDFWAAMWEFAGIKASRGYETVVDDPTRMRGAKWFIGARLNFAENLLRHRDDHMALVSNREGQPYSRMTYTELYHSVARLSKPLRDLRVKPGDRVAGFMPNVIETVVAMLAAFRSRWIAQGLYVCVALMWLVPDRRIERVLAGRTR